MYFRLLMGHVLGDYMLQTRATAYGKQRNLLLSLLHALVYTFCVTLWLLPEVIAAPWLFWAIFASHWPIDHFSLAAKWLHVLGRRGPCEATLPGEAEISAVVYCVVDNGLHLMLMWAALALCGASSAY